MAAPSPFKTAKRPEIQLSPFQIKDFLKSLIAINFSEKKKTSMN